MPLFVNKKFSDEFVETSNPDAVVVEYYSAGGGFLRRDSHAGFHANYQPGTLPSYAPIRVQLDEGSVFNAYGNGQRWNGWLVPKFEFFEAARVMAENGGYFDDEEDVFRIDMEVSQLDEDMVCYPEIIMVDGNPTKVWQIGDGWVWGAPPEVKTFPDDD